MNVYAAETVHQMGITIYCLVLYLLELCIV